MTDQTGVYARHPATIAVASHQMATRAREELCHASLGLSRLHDLAPHQERVRARLVARLDAIVDALALLPNFRAALELEKRWPDEITKDGDGEPEAK